MAKLEFEDSAALCRYVAEVSPDQTYLLSFSGGKDSVVAWLQLRRFFKRVVPVYMYGIPGLEFVEEGLRYAEQFFGVDHILQLPHPSLYRKLNAFVFQPPSHIKVIQEAERFEFDYDDVFAVAKAAYGLPDETYTAIGVRAVDSLNRWAAIQKYGAVNEKRLTFYPCYDFRKEDLVREIVAARYRLPEDYLLFGRSFDGIDWRFLKPLKERRPADYRRILEWFPLAELEVLRIQFREDYYG